MLNARLKYPLLRLLVRLRPYRHWLPAFSFLSGVASFLLVRRSQSLAGVLTALMLLSWLWLTAERVLGSWFERVTGQSLPGGVLRFATQMIHQETFFFVLPFFLVTTTWTTPQGLFTVLVAMAALVSILDPVYFHRLASRRWFYMAYHGFALFVMMLTALPILLHLTTGQSYDLACLASAVLIMPSLADVVPNWRRWRFWVMAGLAVSLAGAAYAGKPWVPPATLWLSRVAVTTSVDEANREPGPQRQVLQAQTLHHQGLYAYTAIRAPRGLREGVYHVWRLNGRVVDRIPLQITGGRRQGYRAWTHKRSFPADPVGRWSVAVMTESGQLVGIVRFRVVDTAPADAIPRPSPESSGGPPPGSSAP